MNSYSKIHVLGLGFTLGIIWGVSLLLMGILGHVMGYGTEFVTAMGTLYVGFAPTVNGAFLGLIWGFLDGFILGILIAFIYNILVKMGSK
ncbi:MAG: bacteriophage holin [Gammaproteobacteria bacterium]